LNEFTVSVSRNTRIARKRRRRPPIEDAHWQHLKLASKTIRSLGDGPLPRAAAKRLAKRLGVGWLTLYRQRLRDAEASDRRAPLPLIQRGTWQLGSG
jgi:hypothetical protein